VSTDWPSFAWHVRVWLCMALLVWTVGILLTLGLVPLARQSHLVPGPVLLVLAGIAVLASTMVVLIVLILAGKVFYPESPRSYRSLVLVGTPLLTLLALWLVTLSVGGIDFFIPRL
jgi:hypothetical protein